MSIAAIKPKRKWIYAKKPSGTYFNYRQVVGYSLLVFLFAAPFIKVKGEAFLMFNIIERKFVLFGHVFWPQDLHIFVFGMLIAMVCVVLFTVVYGRIWCGWACPQTIFMELIFRRIEYWIEGDWQRQRKANAGKMTTSLRWRKILKHSIFFLISFFISNIFLAYIIGIDALWQIMTEPVTQHIVGFMSIICFTLIFYFVFSYLREIVCTTICPYGRLQGVLMDENSMTVAYDYQRGEPRGHRKKDEESQIGDCVDCNLCVQVCPTGIDIRDGIQMECVSCTACIDACDTVMTKLDRPKKLIGFYTATQLEEGKRKSGTNGRAIAYSIVLTLLMVVFGWLIFSRSVLNTTLLRAKGSTYQLREDGQVTNLYNLELINKSNEKISFELSPKEDFMEIQLVNPIKQLESGQTAQLSFFLIGPSEDIQTYKTDVKIDVFSEGRVLKTLKTTFIAPTAGGQSWQTK